MASSPISDARFTNRRIERNGFVAEVLVSHSKALDSQIYHYIIQREGSREIAHWGQEVSMQRALECIDEYIDGGFEFPAMWR